MRSSHVWVIKKLRHIVMNKLTRCDDWFSFKKYVMREDQGVFVNNANGINLKKYILNIRIEIPKNNSPFFEFIFLWFQEKRDVIYKQTCRLKGQAICNQKHIFHLNFSLFRLLRKKNFFFQIEITIK